MNDNKSISTGAVVALGFIVLGILNLFASLHYKKTSLNTTSRWPGIIFIATGIIILFVKMTRKRGD
jgi:protein-S-isoprenylcysteine O-methyltransferase Ste14